MQRPGSASRPPSRAAPPSSRLPATQEERDAPLHVAAVDVLDVSALRGRMRPSTRDRFDEVWELAFGATARLPHAGADADPTTPKTASWSRLTRAHAHELVAAGVAAPAQGPGRGTNLPFTVVEEKSTGLRQRFILWTKDANDRLDDSGYEARVPLEHVSRYLDAVDAEVGSTRDLRCGFYQVAVPPEATDLFSFPDAEGGWYRLTRLPMGHCCAPEIMHTLTSTVAGHPGFVSPEFVVASGVRVDTWIDNIRVSGAEAAVRRATATIDAAAAECGASWKEADSNTAVKTYEFLGCVFRHGPDKSVVPTDKILKKLAPFSATSSSPSSPSPFRGKEATAAQLESLGGRLLHCSAVAGVFPGEYWFTLKFLRRITNKLNRGVLQPGRGVGIPPSVSAELSRWCRAVNKPRRFLPVTGAARVSVFVDASLQGWGGVLVDEGSMEVSIVGGSWGPWEKNLHINVLEALAFSQLCCSTA